MKFFSLLKNNNDVRFSSSSWPWPSCHQPRTLSFRASNINKDEVFKGTKSTTSFFTDSPNSGSFSTASEISHGVDPTETVIRGLHSDRLFFEPDQTSSIWEAKLATLAPFKNSVVFSVDSKHPYVDFRRSMEDMMATHNVKDWEDLEDLLYWFLNVNAKNTHRYILRAFVDLLFTLAVASSSNDICSSSGSNSSLSSSCSSRCAFCFEKEEEVEEEITPASSSSSNF
ncbi:unnamed protein product [Sphenostylis stenocarpa]|uniref:Transcription repressor n=1 Tax=Sphenostylis stenocarpa TaxID=92480 RepID=A0AA86SR14_9FABA|nr:unnamed protein product [Sphenostylis stenocarpa]